MKLNRMLTASVLGFSLLTTSAFACEHGSNSSGSSSHEESHWSFVGWCHQFTHHDCDHDGGQNGGSGNNCDRGKGRGDGACSTGGSTGGGTSTGGGSNTGGGTVGPKG